MIHSLSDVQSKSIGEGTNIWQFCVVLPNAVIGKNCNICSHCLIENDVVIGDNVTVKCGVQLWDDRHPVSRNKNWKMEPVIIEDGAVIGANATILPGVVIGRNAVIGAGAVVTKNVEANFTAVGKFNLLCYKKGR